MKTKTLPVVLVADADPTALAQTIRILSGDQYNVFSAVCQSSALSAAMKLEIDLLLCDLSLAMGERCRDLVSDIHRLPNRSEVPVIFTSSGQGPDVIRRQHDFGGAYHVRKPFDPVVLIELVERALWMPHLVQAHIKTPHFNLNSTAVPARIMATSMISQPLDR
jgi:CheY-like chemotaxis protein